MTKCRVQSSEAKPLCYVNCCVCVRTRPGTSAAGEAGWWMERAEPRADPSQALFSPHSPTHFSEMKWFGPGSGFSSSPGNTADLSLPKLIHLKHPRYKTVPLQTSQRHRTSGRKCIKDKEESILNMQDHLPKLHARIHPASIYSISCIKPVSRLQGLGLFCFFYTQNICS